MKQVRGFWLPDFEQHLVSFLEQGPIQFGGPTYQWHKLESCLPFINEHRHAVDVGAHCGLWTRPLSHMFSMVTAFEPVQIHRECLMRNLREFQRHNVNVHAVALGAGEADVQLHTGDSSSGDTYVQSGTGEHSARMVTLDSVGLQQVDFLKIDCEGYEYLVLRGGEQTVRRDKPCVIVEQKPKKGSQFGLRDTEAVDLLKSWGASLRKEISGDFILAWDT